MRGALSELDFEELAWVVGLGVLGYFIVNRFRESTASSQGGAVFSAQQPAAAVIDRAAEILVPMRTSSHGVAFIKQNEGYAGTVQNDAGHREVGWGHDIVASDNFSGNSVTTAQADSFFANDLAEAEAAVNSGVKVALSQDQFDALVDFAFNIGAGAFASSTLLQMLNAGNYAGASQQFARWVYSAGQKNKGLQNRRGAEQGLFNSGKIA